MGLRVRFLSGLLEGLGLRAVECLGFEVNLGASISTTVDGQILHDPKDPKLWELWYIPYNG